MMSMFAVRWLRLVRFDFDVDGTSEQPSNYGTLAPAIRRVRNDGTDKLCVAGLCGEEEADKAIHEVALHTTESMQSCMRP